MKGGSKNQHKFHISELKRSTFASTALDIQKSGRDVKTLKNTDFYTTWLVKKEAFINMYEHVIVED